jgi:peptidoglycan/LPS O-acetylase OafA/YrhL
MTSTVSAPQVTPAHVDPVPRPEREVRPDIQGLRAIAVGAVVLFHLWPRRVPGGYVGVDVFFVISGFLITSHLLQRPPSTRRELGAFWARRIRRLLPAALVVLVVTLVVSRLFAPALQWASTAREATAAAFYVENWSLASQALDYLAADSAPTPVQHFWSLSVEEQFYLMWPLLVALATVLAARRPRWGPVLTLLGFLGVLGVSFAISVHLTQVEAARAYFVTWTRAWEFAIGGIAAWFVVRTARRVRGEPANLLAWTGLAMIAYSCFLYSGKTAFPGWRAAVPVLGTALVLVTQAEGRRSPAFLWRLPGAQWLGDVSYSVYLWHWPAFILAPYIIDRRLFWPEKLGVVAATLVLAGLSKVLIEDPFRHARRGAPLTPTYRLAAMGMSVVALLAGTQVIEVKWQERQDRVALQRAERNPCFGAGTLLRGPTLCPPDPSGKLVPSLRIAGNDKSSAYKDACFVGAPYKARLVCKYGNGPIKVALVGNSHAGHWLPALQKIAAERGWTITTYLISICNVSDAPTNLRTDRQERNCSDYAKWVEEQTSGRRYDLVITSERQSAQVAGENWADTEAASVRGYRSYLQRWLDSGTRVLVLKDLVPPGNGIGRVPVCLADHPDDRQACTWSATPEVPANPRAYRFSDPLAEAALQTRGRVPVVSVEDLVCPGGRCQPVIGGVVTFFDTSHLTASYARSLSDELGRRILKVEPGL